VLRVATFNVNGIRATHRRGFGDWLAARDCDVVALQEVRAPITALPDSAFGGYHAAYDPGELAGRNGVAILTRMPPAAVRSWGAPAARIDPDGTIELPERGDTAYPKLARELRDFAHQGRYLEVDLADAPVTIASLYLPKGGLPAHLQQPGRMREAPDGGARYERKMRFLAGFARQVTAARRAARAQGRGFLLLGDLNIAHGPLDVVNWRRQHAHRGFPAGGARVPRRADRAAAAGRRRAAGAPAGPGPVLVVELARGVVRQRHRLADRPTTSRPRRLARTRPCARGRGSRAEPVTPG
jgi:exodeoxyribonuclease-3